MNVKFYDFMLTTYLLRPGVFFGDGGLFETDIFRTKQRAKLKHDRSDRRNKAFALCLAFQSTNTFEEKEHANWLEGDPTGRL